MVTFSSDIFEEMAKLLEYVPIDASIPHNGKFMDGTTIDSHFNITYDAAAAAAVGATTMPRILTEGKKSTISFRDIVMLFSRFLKDGLNKSFSLLLSVIVNEPLTDDKDVRELLTLLARATVPRNANTYLDTYGGGFRKRYDIYIEEMKNLNNGL